MAQKQKRYGISMFLDNVDWKPLCESIYVHYPRKVGHKVAIEAIRKSVSEVAERQKVPAVVAAEWLAVRVQQYAVAVKGMTTKYIPHPATWFNQGRYDDDSGEWEAWKQSDAPDGGGDGGVACGFLGKQKQKSIQDEIREAF